MPNFGPYEEYFEACRLTSIGLHVRMATISNISEALLIQSLKEESKMLSSACLLNNNNQGVNLSANEQIIACKMACKLAENMINIQQQNV